MTYLLRKAVPFILAFSSIGVLLVIVLALRPTVASAESSSLTASQSSDSESVEERKLVVGVEGRVGYAYESDIAGVSYSEYETREYEGSIYRIAWASGYIPVYDTINGEQIDEFHVGGIGISLPAPPIGIAADDTLSIQAWLSVVDAIERERLGELLTSRS